MSQSSLKIAIVGSGVSGLASLWALKSTGHEVHLFEARDQLGGHVQTVEWKGSDGARSMVDVAFTLFNTVTYRESL
jgi:predicted NAD/FAD-binding protein